MSQTVNEYLKEQKDLALFKQQIRDELTDELTRVITKQLEPEIRKEVMLSIEQNHYLVPKQKKEIDVNYFVNVVIAEVSQAFKITQYEVLISKSRVNPLPDARGAISYICRTMQLVPYTVLAKTLNKNHATMIHGKKQCENLMATDRGYKALIEQILKSVKDKTSNV